AAYRTPFFMDSHTASVRRKKALPNVNGAVAPKVPGTCSGQGTFPGGLNVSRSSRGYIPWPGRSHGVYPIRIRDCVRRAMRWLRWRGRWFGEFNGGNECTAAGSHVGTGL